MRKIIYKRITKGFLLFLFTFFCVGVQGQERQIAFTAAIAHSTEHNELQPVVSWLNEVQIPVALLQDLNISAADITTNLQMSINTYNNTFEILNSTNLDTSNFNFQFLLESLFSSYGTVWGNTDAGVFNYSSIAGGGGSGGGGGGGAGTPTDPINCPGIVCPYGYSINADCECINLSLKWYFDADGDGWHSKTQLSQTIPGSFNWSLNTLGLDCDDTLPEGKYVQADCTKITWVKDEDDDKYYVAGSELLKYNNWPPTTGYKKKENRISGDCDDNDSLLKKNCTFKLLAVQDETGNDIDKHVFNKTGNLNIKVVFELSGETDTNALKALIPQLSITIDMIGTQLVSSSVQNSGTKFEVLLTKKGMPDKNSDFGKKNIYLKYKGTAKNTKAIKVFFDKDDKTNKLGVPNWFYYWKEGNVCGIPATAIYDSTADFGYTKPGVDSILRLGPDAPTINTGPETFAALKTTYGSITVTGTGSGIYCVAETVAHELYHLTLYNSSRGQLDTDKDQVSNASEAGGFGATTDPLDSDTFNLRGLYPVYATYGDNEVRCRKKELNTGIAVRNDLDWSKDGKQW